ncbi:MAG: sigma-70 family RNA polymerase sigma factor [Candidatus Omnitrophota bacterium]
MEFEELVKKLSPTLKRITYKLNGHFTFFSDEDLFQEALIRLFEEFQEGKLEDKTDSYILQGCYFHLKNYIRKTRDNAQMVSLSSLINEEGSELEEMLPSDVNFPHPASGQDRVLIGGLEDSGLTEREKRLISLCMEGFTVRQIGEKLGVSHVMVVRLRNDIRNKCRRIKEELLK